MNVQISGKGQDAGKRECFQDILKRMQSEVAARIVPLPSPGPAFVLFFSFSDTTCRATTLTASASSFKDTWKAATEKLRQAVTREKMEVLWLRVDWVVAVEKTDWSSLNTVLDATRRNYFRCGISLDRAFRTAFLETELNANAMLYGPTQIQHAMVNKAMFSRYAKVRHGMDKLKIADDASVYAFSTQAAFASHDSDAIHQISGTGLATGRRDIATLTPDQVDGLIHRGSRYLASQVREDGRFIYGWHPCFDREINTYNSLRHASTLYAMIEAWEATGDEALKDAIERGLHYLTQTLIQIVMHEGTDLAVLVDTDDEVKLGGNAVCLLALVKYSELTGTDRYLALLEKLALAMVHMQDPVTGRFDHVFSFPDLKVKEHFRIIYYDGEAAFGLMRLYALTRDARWLDAVERGFGHFISAQHWQAHDHWLAYATNALTLYRPKEAYYAFGLRNFSDYLDFVTERETTFPTLLELMMAARQMIQRLEQDDTYSSLLETVDLDKFYTALNARAHNLLNGHFWPELAMFYANPQRIVGSFFIRHHAFRVRIDDVEHYLSGLIAYGKYLREAHSAE